jgi:hypothetical protein
MSLRETRQGTGPRVTMAKFDIGESRKKVAGSERAAA